ncbi:MAG: hypothetical protein AB7G93_07420 [Bdellovibrionales bacterium]
MASQRDRLDQLLESLYQQGGNYTLNFRSSDLAKIEQAFDRIIQRFGYKLGVDFTYAPRDEGF